VCVVARAQEGIITFKIEKKAPSGRSACCWFMGPIRHFMITINDTIRYDMICGVGGGGVQPPTSSGSQPVGLTTAPVL
jgi:hypothetical protein